MRHRRASLWVLALVWSPLHAFVSLAPIVPCRTDRHDRIRQVPRRLHISGSRRLTLAMMTSDEGEDEQETVVSTEAEMMKHPGLLVATGVSGAFVGWSLIHALGLDLDGFGAISGCVLAVGLLAQGGAVGRVATNVGRLTLGAFDVLQVVATKTDVPSKVVGTVSNEILEVVELTSGAVTKGYMENVPDATLGIQRELDLSKKRVAELKENLERVMETLAQAQEQLEQRSLDQKLLAAAKSTSSQLKEAKRELASKDAMVAEGLRVAKDEKAAFDRDLQAAKAEIVRLRDMAESQANLDESFKALTQASEVLENRVQEYEERLNTLTSENDNIRADYASEVENMNAERNSMRERISELESSLAGVETHLGEQRAAFEGELASMAEELQLKADEAEAATQRVAQLQQAVESAAAADEAKAKGTAEQVATLEEQLQMAEAFAKQAQEAERASARAMAEADARAAQLAQAAKEEAKARIEAELQQREAEVARERAEVRAQQDAKKVVGVEEAEHRARGEAEAEVAAGPHKAMAGAKSQVLDAPTTYGEVATQGNVATQESLMKLTVKDLRELCKEARVPTSGKKVELVGRLLSSAASAEA